MATSRTVDAASSSSSDDAAKEFSIWAKKCVEKYGSFPFENFVTPCALILLVSSLFVFVSVPGPNDRWVNVLCFATAVAEIASYVFKDEPETWSKQTRIAKSCFAMIFMFGYVMLFLPPLPLYLNDFSAVAIFVALTALCSREVENFAWFSAISAVLTVAAFFASSVYCQVSDSCHYANNGLRIWDEGIFMFSYYFSVGGFLVNWFTGSAVAMFCIQVSLGAQLSMLHLMDIALSSQPRMQKQHLPLYQSLTYDVLKEHRASIQFFLILFYVAIAVSSRFRSQGAQPLAPVSTESLSLSEICDMNRRGEISDYETLLMVLQLTRQTEEMREAVSRLSLSCQSVEEFDREVAAIKSGYKLDMRTFNKIREKYHTNSSSIA